MILDAPRVLVVVFCVFVWILQFGELGSKKGGKTVSKRKKEPPPFGVIFGTFATLCAVCLFMCFLEVTVPFFS